MIEQEVRITDKESGEIRYCCIKTAIDLLSGFWKNDDEQIEKMLKDNQTLWTSFSFYEIASKKIS